MKISAMKKFKPVFYPDSVAVVGASKDARKFGYLCLKSLVNSEFQGSIYPINPGSSEILGLKSYPSIKSIPAKVDLAIIVVPAELVPSVLQECSHKGIKGAVIITAGFKEAEGFLGAELQDEARHIADNADIKIIGPNTFGMFNTHADLNASFTPLLSTMPQGDISFVSQSGGMCHTVSYLALDDGIGLDKVLSLGNRCNVDFADILEFLGEDLHTRAIAMYIEGIDNPRSLVEAAKKVVRKKPVVAYKIGKSQTASRAAYSHTGSLAGNYELYDAALRQAGVLMVNDSVELLDTAKALAFCPPAQGRRIAFCSPVAGPGIVSADCGQGHGLTIAEFSAATREKIEAILPPRTFRMNPLDMAFARDLDMWQEILMTIINDPGVDAMLIFFVKQEFFDPIIGGVVELLIDLLKTYMKPIVMCLISPRDIFVKEKAKLQKNRIPVYQTPERAVRALAALVKYSKMRQSSGIQVLQAQPTDI